MAAGTTIVRAIWQALGLELPASRRPHLMQFFAGLKPLSPVAYASLLRAAARALIESGLVPVRKDARHDPVELIAAAVEVSIEKWDREIVERRWSLTARDDFWNDLAVRVAAFEALFEFYARDPRWHTAQSALADAMDEDHAAPKTTTAFDRDRFGVRAAVKSKPEHAEAMLAELVVIGPHTTHLDACIPKALPLAHGMALVRARRVREALRVFEAILDSVPGHTLALQQAARCCVECGVPSEAKAYTRRASGRVETSRLVTRQQQRSRSSKS